MLTLKADLINKLADLIIAAMPALDKLNRALKMIDDGKWPNAQEFLNQIAINIDTITTAYGRDVSSLKDLKKTFDEAVKLVKEKKPEAKEKIQTLINVLSLAESKIKQLALRRE